MPPGPFPEHPTGQPMPDRSPLTRATWRQSLQGWLWVAPALLFLVVFVYGPALTNIRFSLFSFCVSLERECPRSPPLSTLTTKINYFFFVGLVAFFAVFFVATFFIKFLSICCGFRLFNYLNHLKIFYFSLFSAAASNDLFI